MAKSILGIVKEASKGEDPRTKNAGIQTHTLRVIEARKRDAARARMITTHTGRTK